MVPTCGFPPMCRAVAEALFPAPEPDPEPALEEEPSGSPWPTGHRFADRTRSRHASVHALLEAGHSLRSVQRQLGMAWHTVKRFADATKPEDLFTGQWQNRPSVLDDYKSYLDHLGPGSGERGFDSTQRYCSTEVEPEPALMNKATGRYALRVPSRADPQVMLIAPEELRDRTVWKSDAPNQLKHLVYRHYQKCRMAKIFQKFPEATIVNGFAGPGMYDDGPPGSLVVVGRCFLEHTARRRFGRLKCPQLHLLRLERSPGHWHSRGPAPVHAPTDP